MDRYGYQSLVQNPNNELDDRPPVDQDIVYHQVPETNKCKIF